MEINRRGLYDPRAVRIDWNGAKLGYLPRLDDAAVSQLLDRGEHLTDRIAALAEERDPWRRIPVEVYLNPSKQTDLTRDSVSRGDCHPKMAYAYLAPFDRNAG